MKKKILMIVLCFAVVLCSCNSSDNLQPEETKPAQENVTSENMTSDNETLSDSENQDLSETSEFEVTELPENLDFGDTAYNIETDAQTGFGAYSYYVATADGYYHLKQGDGVGLAAANRLIYIDRESRVCVPVCTRPDCTHNEEDCDAIFGMTLDNQLDFISCFDGSLYGLTYESDDSANTTTTILRRLSKDGSVRENLFDLCTYHMADIQSGSIDMGRGTQIGQYILHRGYIYYVVHDGTSSTLYRRNLEKGEAEEIYAIEAESTSLGSLWAYGDGVVFMYDTYTGEEWSEGKLLYYSSIDGKLYSVIEGVDGYIIIEDSLVYSYQGSIYKMNLNTLEKELFIETEEEYPSISSDGKYIYVDNLNAIYNIEDPRKSEYDKRKIEVYDVNANHVDTIDMAGLKGSFMAGDASYMFYSDSDGEYVLDKSQIGTGVHEWIEIETE